MAESKQTLVKCDNADHQKEIQYIRENLPSWKQVGSDEITIEKFPFGHSRPAYRITASNPQVQPNPILLRKFLRPDARESDLFQKLGDLGWGPKCFHRGENIRIEQYFDSTIITCQEINHQPIRRMLAIKLAQLHKLEGLVDDEKGGFLNKVMDGAGSPQNRITMQLAKQNLALDIYDEEEQKTVNECKQAVSEQEIEFLKKKMEGYPLVWGHNDIWSGNILLLKNKQDVVFVDFEMMDYNFAGYDLAKLILETLYQRNESNAGYKFLGVENLPNEEEIRDFIMFYFIGKYGIQPQPDKTPQELLRTQFASDEELQIAIQKFYEEVQLGFMMSGYYSMLVGMRLGKNAGFDMDFFQFAKDGLEVYKVFKKKLYNL